MRWFIFILLAVVGSWVAVAASTEVKHWTLQGVVVHLVVTDSWGDLTVTNGMESLTHLMGRMQPRAVLSGPYFNPATGQPVCAVVREGKLLAAGLCHSYLLVSACGAIVGYSESGVVEWPARLQVGLGGGPILVRDGELHLNQRDEGFSDPRVFGVARRTAVGLTRAGKLVMLATNAEVGLKRWSKVMLAAGLTDAFNLDGGGSAALYAEGRMWVRPQRALPCYLVVR